MTDRDSPRGTRVEQLSIKRRDVLKATAAAAVGTSAVGTVSGEDYDTVVVPANTRHNVSVGDGETLSNVLYDITADGAGVHINASGNGWTLRNIGIEGTHPGGYYQIIPGVPDPAGTGLIENVYQGDGQVAQTGGGGVWINANLPHRGTITFRNCHIAGFVDNGLYGSGPGAQGYDGNHHVDTCYFYNNTISNNRANGRARTCNMTDSVVLVDGGQPPCGTGCSAPGSTNTRVTWAWYGEMHLENCDLRGAEMATAEGGFYTGNWRFGQDANIYIPDCVPETPVEAASNTSCDGSGGGGDAVEVAEDFEHNDVPGTYNFDTGEFTITSTRSTDGSYSLTPSASSDNGVIIERDDMVTTAGNTYELDAYLTSGTDEDLGFLFAAQDSTTGWSDYSGYLGFFDSNNDQVRLDLWQDGSLVSNATSAGTWPLDEWLSVELDYRESDSSTITMTVFDATGTEVNSVSFSDTTYDSGAVGWYNFWASADWHADSWFNVDLEDVEPTAIDDFEGQTPLDEYSGATDLFSVDTSTVYEGEQAITNDGGSFGSAVSTSGLDAYPERGDEIHYYFNNAADDNFVAFHLFAQAEEDAPDGYSIGISSAGAWRMWVQENGDMTQIADQDLSSSEQISGWYRAEVWSDSTTVYADLYDDANDALIASISADDTTYASGGIGFRSAGNGEVWDYTVRAPIEDVERSDPLNEYGGATDLFSVETSTVFEGVQAITNDGASFGSAVSTSGLREYPDRGETVHYRFNNAADDNFVAFHLFAQAEEDVPDSYSIGISSAGAWRMWRHENGETTEIASTDLPTGDQIVGWYRAEVSSDDTTIYADLHDDAGKLLASIQADDTTYASGGIGFRSAGNGEVWDYVIR